jgi:YVTN family beta-propeller protein
VTLPARGPSFIISAILRIRFLVTPLALVAVLAACSAEPLNLPLTFQKDIQLPKETAGLPAVDLLTLDSASGRLYVPHGSANTLEIIDVKTAQVIGSVPNLPGIKDTALSSDPNIVFTANGNDGSVSVVDVKQLKVVDNIKMGTSADAIDYDPVSGLILVSLDSKILGVIDEKTRKETGKMTLPGKPELRAIDKQGLVFQAINDKDEVLLIDPVARSVVKTYKGCDIKSPTGLALDPDQQRLFVANAIPHTANVVSVVDVLVDRCLGTIDVDHSPDQAAFNSQLHHLYVANAGSNNVTVIDTVALKPIGVAGTGKQAATIAADPVTNTVWVAAARSGIIAKYHDP